jgi:hypothetical protein
MSKKRSSVKKAEVHGMEKSFERRARNFAFETGMQIEVQGLEVFIMTDGRKELLCIADDSKHLWRATWQAMAREFPALEKYISHRF